ncbi:MAG: M23 family metallopeptidase [Hyphomonas sp.]
MRSRLSVAGLSLLMFGLTACDVVRFPGDGLPPPSTPEPGPVIPPGAPGPPPPDPEDDPWALPPIDDTDPVDLDPIDTDPPTDPEPPPPEPEPQPDPEPPAPPPPPPPPPEPVFSYFAPGALLPGTGGGFPDQIVHAPDILFPIKSAPAYLQSQVFTFGGGVAGGDQCDPRNYDYPWRDNFCETRSANRGTPFCPVNRIHQGQDIRVGTAADCNALRRQSLSERGIHEVVAVEDGIITSIGTYTVKLRGDGAIYNYMHLNMNRLAVTAGQFVQAGDLLGYVSNDFGGTPTTIHLHFEIVQNSAAHGWVHVSPYLSLVSAYERRQNGPGEQLEQPVVVASEDIWVIPEGFEIIE